MRIIDIIKRANRNLLRSKTRTILTVLAIFIGAFTLTITLALGEGAQTFINNQASTFKVNNALEISKASPGFRSSNAGSPRRYSAKQSTGIEMLTQNDLQTIRQIPNIISVTPIYSLTPQYITTPGSDKYVITLTNYFSNLQPSLEAGSLPSSSDTGYILLPDSYVSVLGFANPDTAVGQNVMVFYQNGKGETLEEIDTIKGVLVNSIIASGSGYISGSEAQSIHDFQYKGTPLATSYLGAYGVYNSNLTSSQVNTIKDDLANENYKGQTYEDLIAQVNSVIQTVEIALSIVGIIAILVSTFGIVNTLLMSVYERTREIGLMKALGLSSKSIFVMFAAEAASIGFWGGFLGTIIAVGVGQIVNKILSQGVLKDFYHYQLLAFSPIISILVIIFLMVIGMLAGTIPSIKASRLDPIEALRYE